MGLGVFADRKLLLQSRGSEPFTGPLHGVIPKKKLIKNSYVRPLRPFCPLLVCYVPPETDLCPAQSMPGHKPSRRAAAPHQPRRPAARASHRVGNKSVPRQSIASTKRISRVSIKFSRKLVAPPRSATFYRSVTGHALPQASFLLLR